MLDKKSVWSKGLQFKINNFLKMRENLKNKINHEPTGLINGFQIQLVSYKFLWFTFYSKHKIRVYPGYFINEDKDKIVLENEIIKSIYKPKANTWYYVYLLYKNKKVINIIFDDILYKGNCSLFRYKRISVIFINKKGRFIPRLYSKNAT